MCNFLVGMSKANLDQRENIPETGEETREQLFHSLLVASTSDIWPECHILLAARSFIPNYGITGTKGRKET